MILNKDLIETNTPYNVVSLETSITNNKLWLIGVAGPGIIVCEGIVDSEDIENGTAIDKVGSSFYGASFHDYCELRWYTTHCLGFGAIKIREKYRRLLLDNPKLVFLSIPELEIKIYKQLYLEGGEEKNSEELKISDLIEVGISKKIKTKTDVDKKSTDIIKQENISYVPFSNELEIRLDFSKSEDEPEDDCMYYSLVHTYNKEQREVLVKNRFISHKEFSKYGEALEPYLVRMIALREANFLWDSNLYRENSWSQDDNNFMIAQRITKKDGLGGKYEIVLYRSRNHRNKILNKE